MTLREKVAQMLMPSFIVWNEGDKCTPVEELNGELCDCIRENSFGGVILFETNAATQARTTELVQRIQEENAKGNAVSGLFVSIDQEGGNTVRLMTGTQMPGNMALGATGNPANARTAAEVIGEELDTLGINLDFAPVLDVNSNPKNPIIGIRSFSDNPNRVAVYGGAFIDGLHSKGVMAAAKHFPGHGDTNTDSHVGLPRIDKSLKELEKCELIPFARLSDKVDFMMTAHIEYPQIEQATYTSKLTGQEIFLPATLSEKIVTGILREKMGFEGVVITDAMNMKAIASHFDRFDAARLAIEAGVDMILMPSESFSAEGLKDLTDYIDTLTEMVQTGQISAEKIDVAVTRILKKKAEFGLLGAQEDDKTDLSSIINRSKFEPAKGTNEGEAKQIGSKEHHLIEWELALKGVSAIKKNENVLPVGTGKKVLIAVPQEDHRLSVRFALDRLKADGVIISDDNIEIMCYNDAANDGETKSQTGGEGIPGCKAADTVIAISAAYTPADLDPEMSKKTAFLKNLLDETHRAGKEFVFISAALPYDAEVFKDADGILACYGAGGMNKLPGAFEKDTPKYGPNIPAAVYTAFGGSEPGTFLPVKL